MIEEQHVTQYGALIDPSCTWLESLLMHEYIECYLYYSCFEDETDRRVKKLWEMNFEKEVAQLHAAAKLLQKYEKKSWQQVLPDGAFPELLNFSEQKEYVRRVLAQTATQTARREDFVEVDSLPDDAPFFRYQDTVNPNAREVPSHRVIRDAISELGQDYRFEESPSPIPALRSRKKDNTTLGRTKGEGK